MAVGFDLYCQLLKQAVAQLKGEKLKPRAETEMRLDFVATNEGEYLRAGPDSVVPAFIPSNYISETSLRIQAYRKLAEINATAELARIKREWRDRFGKFPLEVDNLLLLTEIKLSAARASISRVEVRQGKLMLSRRGDFILVGGKFPRLSFGRIDLNLAEILQLIKQL
jgi:transcription-repair coupling factor (superfamily II helicase)